MSPSSTFCYLIFLILIKYHIFLTLFPLVSHAQNIVCEFLFAVHVLREQSAFIWNRNGRCFSNIPKILNSKDYTSVFLYIQSSELYNATENTSILTILFNFSFLPIISFFLGIILLFTFPAHCPFLSRVVFLKLFSPSKYPFPF